MTGTPTLAAIVSKVRCLKFAVLMITISLVWCVIAHPEGHKILALVLAYCMVEEEKDLLRHNSDKAEIERDFTIHGKMRDPVYLSLEEEAMYVQKDTDVSTDIDFTDPDGESDIATIFLVSAYVNFSFVCTRRRKVEEICFIDRFMDLVC